MVIGSVRAWRFAVLLVSMSVAVAGLYITEKRKSPADVFALAGPKRASITPDVGTLVVLNGEVKGNPIPGYDVYRALLRVWLGDRPTSAGLKNALLGRTDQ